MIVTKFGGSSVASSEQFKKVKHIIESHPDRQIVISSAVGKKNSDDRELIIKWVSECFCGVTDSSELDTVKHKVGV